MWDFSIYRKTSASMIGIGEIILTIILVMLVDMIIRWCCKRYTKSRAASQRNLEQTIRQNAGMQAAGPTAPIFAAQQPPAGMMPMVTFTNPGERRVNFTQPASHWETCKWSGILWKGGKIELDTSLNEYVWMKFNFIWITIIWITICVICVYTWYFQISEPPTVISV